MGKWTLRLIVLSLIAMFTVAVLYERSTHVARGWLRGEAFFDGRPTSYWREVIVIEHDAPQPTLCQRVLTATLGMETRATSFALTNDGNAKPVLQQLARDEDMRVKEFARHFRDWKSEGSDQQREFEQRVEWQFWWMRLNLNRFKTEYRSDK